MDTYKRPKLAWVRSKLYLAYDFEKWKLQLGDSKSVWWVVEAFRTQGDLHPQVLPCDFFYYILDARTEVVLIVSRIKLEDDLIFVRRTIP